MSLAAGDKRAKQGRGFCPAPALFSLCRCCRHALNMASWLPYVNATSAFSLSFFFGQSACQKKLLPVALTLATVGSMKATKSNRKAGATPAALAAYFSAIGRAGGRAGSRAAKQAAGRLGALAKWGTARAKQGDKFKTVADMASRLPAGSPVTGAAAGSRAPGRAGAGRGAGAPGGGRDNHQTPRKPANAPEA